MMGEFIFWAPLFFSLCFLRLSFPPRTMMEEFSFWGLISLLCVIYAQPPANHCSINEEPTHVLILELGRRFHDAAGRFWNLVFWDHPLFLWNLYLRCLRSGMTVLHRTDWSPVTNYLESAWVDLKAVAVIAIRHGSYLLFLVSMGNGLLEKFSLKKSLGFLVLCG